jgi:hypothetical protein
MKTLAELTAFASAHGIDLTPSQRVNSLQKSCRWHCLKGVLAPLRDHGP